MNIREIGTRNALLLLVLLCVGGCFGGGREVSPAFSTPRGWPVDSEYRRISSHFGMRNGRMHNGIDMPGPKGSPIYATADGLVIFSGRMDGYGRLVRIRHGRYETWYAHLRARGVKQGQWVRRGQRIGRMGKSGRTWRSHLHYEVRINGKPVDPSPYLNPGSRAG